MIGARKCDYSQPTGAPTVVGFTWKAPRYLGRDCFPHQFQTWSLGGPTAGAAKCTGNVPSTFPDTKPTPVATFCGSKDVAARECWKKEDAAQRGNCAPSFERCSGVHADRASAGRNGNPGPAPTFLRPNERYLARRLEEWMRRRGFTARRSGLQGSSGTVKRCIRGRKRAPLGLLTSRPTSIAGLVAVLRYVSGYR